MKKHFLLPKTILLIYYYILSHSFNKQLVTLLIE